MRLNKREVTEFAEQLNAMHQTIEETSGKKERQDTFHENVGAYFSIQSILLKMDGDSADRVYAERRRLGWGA